MSEEHTEYAFPMPNDGTHIPGMTLRDYFAAKAMQAYIGIEPTRHGANAAMAYGQADAMLKARQP